MKSWDKVISDISSLRVQGATNVALAVMTAIEDFVSGNDWESVEKARMDTGQLLFNLSTLRTTEPLSRNIASFLAWQMVKEKQETIPEFRLFIEGNTALLRSKLSDIEEQIIKFGSSLIKPGMHILTHCHSGSVEKILKAAHKNGVDFHVFLTETRPLFQGRITAEHLTEMGIKATMIPDSYASFSISQIDDVDFDLILLGCDAIAVDGSCANKIGSYGIALSSHEAKVPLYIVGTLLKIDQFTKTGEQVKIEIRSGEEIWKDKPTDLDVLNPAFDIIPKELIFSYVTEAGIIEPGKAYKSAKRLYPWIAKENLKLKEVWEESNMNKGNDEVQGRKLSYLHVGEKFDPREHIIATFHLEANYPLAKAAEDVAAESSVGTWTDIKTQKKAVFDKLSAKIYNIDEKNDKVYIAYPLELFEPSNIPQLLSSVAGNIFSFGKFNFLRLEDLELPETYVKSFKGPQLGVEGIRDLIGIYDRPLLGSILKPKEGLSYLEHAEIAEQVYEGGIDFEKDDENLTSPVFNPFDKRVVEVMKRIKRLEKRLGEKKYYAFNTTAEAELMRERAVFVKEQGGRCIMVDIITCGFSGLQYIRNQNFGMIIHGHRAMHAAFTRLKKHGISMLVIAKMARLAGVDELHTGTVVGKMEGGEEEVHSINKFLLSEWYGLKRVMPVASGGLYPGLVPQLYKLLGKDAIFNFGGGIHGHPDGSKAGAKAAKQALDATMKGISLETYAMDHIELARALKHFP